MKNNKEKINRNSVSLAGEFAVLSQLVLRGLDANMTLGNTKNVDILVSNPFTKKMYKLEVKTNFKNTRNQTSESKIFGKTVSGWIMHKKHETIKDPDLFYCFVNISNKTENFKFYIVPSNIVAKYIKEECELWIKTKKDNGEKFKITEMRNFRLGINKEKYKIATPLAEKYENNWDFKK